MHFLAFPIKSSKHLTGVGYFNKPGQETVFFHIEIGLEVSTLNCTTEPQTPNAPLWIIICR